ncbi:MAG: endonuclease III domain-containing protein [Nitrospirae bacterium]|nr:MAG: endonuclease III domain-containing protein [Nitrospirota bacterium]
MPSNKDFIKEAFHLLYNAFGPQNWWPAESPFEVIVGAILTQNTNWKNVERAIENLKAKGLLEPFALVNISEEELASLIRPAGYYNIKAKRLKEFLKVFCERWDCSIEKMKSTPQEELRKALLEIKGIGPETADSILLYALGRAVFVVDAYTKRILKRHGVIDGKEDYETIRELFEGSLPRDVTLYNEYHALIVRVGKTCCKNKTPLCEECPLGVLFPQGLKDNVSTAGRAFLS